MRSSAAMKNAARLVPLGALVMLAACAATPAGVAPRDVNPNVEIVGESLETGSSDWMPESSTSAAEVLIDIAKGVGVGLLAVVAVATSPIWLPILCVKGGVSFMPAPGRPLRRNGRACAARLGRGAEWLANAAPDVSALAAEDRSELARSWLLDAQAEHASIAAFSALSLDLIAVGAPPRLLEATHRAALDEVVHARLCFALASAYAGEALGPAELPEAHAPRRSASAAGEIARLAVESLQDGCLNEGFAATVAREEAAGASDEAVRAALAVIARDEERHVELAWAIVAWCAERGAKDALLAAAERLPEDPCLAIAVSDRAALVAHGRLGAERLRAIFASTRAAVIERVRATSSPSPAPSRSARGA